MKFYFIRGLAREARHWGDFVSRFERGIEGAKVQCIDLPGAGEKKKTQVPLTISEMVETMRRDLPFEKKKAILFGLSLGGMVSLEWAAKYPVEIAGVIVINPSAGGLSPFWKRMHPLTFLKLVRSAIEWNPRKREWLLLNAIAKHPNNKVLEEWVKIAELRTIKPQAALRQLIAAARFVCPSKLDVPLLVLTSQGDQLASPSAGGKIATHLKGKLVTHPDAGHELPVDDPDWIIERVKEFLEEQKATMS